MIIIFQIKKGVDKVSNNASHANHSSEVQKCLTFRTFTESF